MGSQQGHSICNLCFTCSCRVYNCQVLQVDTHKHRAAAHDTAILLHCVQGSKLLSKSILATEAVLPGACPTSRSGIKSVRHTLYGVTANRCPAV